MTGVRLRAAEILNEARLAAGPQSGYWGRIWPRAAALLTRTALEEGVRSRWTGELESLRECSWRHQFLCLPHYVADPELARAAYLTWIDLSRACHAHPYDLDPTVSELETWMSTVQLLLDPDS